MSFLSRVQRGRTPKPPRLVLYGTEGIGKSTFASQAPSPIFIQIEDGLAELDCAKFPLARSLNEVTAALQALHVDQHDFETVVIDSLDWLERLIWDALCLQHNVTSIEKVDGGYARGYTHAVGYWRVILAALDGLRDERGMAVIGIAHSKVERVEDPEATAFDRHAPRLHKHACGLVCEWADAVLFAGRKMRVQSEDAGFNRKRGVAFGLGKEGGDRILRCIGGPACISKNRYGLPEELPLSWAAFMAAMTNTQTATTGANTNG